MKRWRLECNHGYQHGEPEVNNSEKWRDLGPLDSIKAILIKKAAYRVKLIFLQLASAEEAIACVAQRVEQGGHNIPEKVIHRRFAAGLANLHQLYAPKVDAWMLYDNAGTQPMLLDRSEIQ